MSTIFASKQSKTEQAGQNYRHGLNAIQLHYYGGYMSYSDYSGDHIARATELTPFKVFEQVQVQTGEKQEIRLVPSIQRKAEKRDGSTITVTVHTGEPAEQQIVTVPVYETVKNDVTPAFVAYGKPIQIGDRVQTGLVTGTLAELSDHHFVIDADTGKHYFSWARSSVTIDRA